MFLAVRRKFSAPIWRVRVDFVGKIGPHLHHPRQRKALRAYRREANAKRDVKTTKGGRESFACLRERPRVNLRRSIASSGRSAVQPDEAVMKRTSRRQSFRLPRLTSRSRETCVSMETHFNVMNLARAPICLGADIGQPGQLRMRRKACHECEGCMSPRQLAKCSHMEMCREPFQIAGSRHNLRGSSEE